MLGRYYDRDEAEASRMESFRGLTKEQLKQRFKDAERQRGIELDQEKEKKRLKMIKMDILEKRDNVSLLALREQFIGKKLRTSAVQKALGWGYNRTFRAVNNAVESGDLSIEPSSLLIIFSVLNII